MTRTRLSYTLSLQPHLALVGVVIAAIGQYGHTYLSHDAAPLLYAIALVLWCVSIISSRAAVGTRIDDSGPPREYANSRFSILYAALAVLLAFVTFITSSGNTFHLDNVATWLLSILLFVYAFWEPERDWSSWQVRLKEWWQRFRASFDQGFRISLRAIIFIGILVLGWFFYFYDLDGIPLEMHSDHAEKILDVNDIVRNELRPIFLERNTGREPLQFYLVAALVEFGRHPLDFMALKLVTATIGWLVIPGTYLLARELLDDDAAILSAGLVAISKWPITIARAGLRFPFTPVFVAPMAFFLIRGLKYKRRNDFLMAGLFLGAGLLGYNAFRMAPVLVLAFLVLWLLSGKVGRPELPRFALNALLVAGLAFIIFLPLLRYSTEHPEFFWYRVLTRLSGQEQPVPSGAVQVFSSNLVNAVLMFNWTGDTAWPNSIQHDPALDYVSGGLFLFGVAYAVYRIARFRERSYLFVLAGLLIMLLPSALSLAFPNENPSNVRAGGAIPFVFMTVAVPIVWIFRSLRERWSAIAASIVVLAIMVVIGSINFVRYFSDFNANYRERSWNSSQVAQVIKSFADTVGDYDHAYILLYPHWIDTRNVAIHMGRIGWDQTLQDANAAEAHKLDGSSKLYVLHPFDSNNLARLQEIFPNGQMRTVSGHTPGHDFVFWYVPGTIAPSDQSVGR